MRFIYHIILLDIPYANYTKNKVLFYLFIYLHGLEAQIQFN